MPEIQMPKLSDTMTEGTLVAWKKKKGDQVSAGEVLAEIETDKATMEWESPEDGTLTEIYVPEGGKVNVGDKIGFIRGQGEDAPKEETPARKKKTEAVSEEKPQAETEKPAPAETAETETAPPQKKNAGAPVPAAQVETTPQKPQAREQKSEEPRVKASPVARRLAGELGVDLSTVKGTGPDGRVTETDVRAAGNEIRGAGASPRRT
jgi:pyruvate dehydrogenase E2 component (dihydrolipoamide acetyltransferase)